MRSRYRLAVTFVFIASIALGKGAGDSMWSDLLASMDKMHASMNAAKPSGDGDADFVTLMLPHHQAAIDMAKAELIYGTDPQMRRLAQEIVADQQSEIELMQLWLKRQRQDPETNNHHVQTDSRKGQ
jgi:uncharacterized protein (DUF305 family)